MCEECDGLGEAYSFDVDLLIPAPELSVKKGCFEPLGGWRNLGRWRRAVFQGVADSVERKHKLPAGTMLETPWSKLKPKLKKLWLWGTGDGQHHDHLARWQLAHQVRHEVRRDHSAYAVALSQREKQNPAQ